MMFDAEPHSAVNQEDILVACTENWQGSVKTGSVDVGRQVQNATHERGSAGPVLGCKN